MANDELGLTSDQAARRLAEVGPNELRAQKSITRVGILWNQLRNPLLLLLVVAAATSAATAEWVDASIVFAIVIASVGIAYSREFRAQAAAAALRARVHTRATVIRDGAPVTIPAREIVPGDLVLLAAGSLVPADGAIVEATDFFVNEAVLTGESFPVEKREGPVFLGTNVRSGAAKVRVEKTGAATELGHIAHKLTLRPPETEFDRGIRHFGYLLTTAMLVMVVVVFAANLLLGKPVIETLLFTIALAVGLSPELLPAILSVNLARGSQQMAQHGVLVKHLAAIENLGSMDVLCTDKTGTLTEGVVRLEGAYDPSGARSDDILRLARWNAALHTGVANPLDDAILADGEAPPGAEKLGEIPYDFMRKRLSVIVRTPDGVRLITKGAFEEVLSVCNGADEPALRARFEAWAGAGVRVLAVATRAIAEQDAYTRADEHDLTLCGFLTFLDHAKPTAARAIADLAAKGVAVKMISGDARLVAQHLAGQVGLRPERVLTGKQIAQLPGDALRAAADRTDLFVEVDPAQKERIILALKKAGHVVGYLGDGVNDAPAMHAADTSLSVDAAVDVAKEAADFVLLDRDLDVIRRGIEEGRHTFANTLKYVNTTTSANLGNMVSMAVASLFLPFLPLLAGQILLNNFLSDIPAIGIADDSVDPEMIELPRRWQMGAIARFMVGFGVLSSVFDFLTFGALLWVFDATPELFRTGWFVESLLTELVIALVVRTRRPFFASRPGRVLLISTLVLIPIAILLPYVPGIGVLGLMPMPPAVVGALVAITALYVAATETAKRFL